MIVFIRAHNWGYKIVETKEVIFKNDKGLEARTAAKLIQVVSNCRSNIWIEKNERKANTKSLLGLLSLTIRQGDKITISAEGEDASDSVNNLAAFIQGL
jgi:phosphotransferase system HPr (HPr) family protein